MPKVVFALRIDPELAREVRALAKRRGDTASATAEALIRSALRRGAPEPQPKSKPSAAGAARAGLEEAVVRRAAELRARGVSAPMALRRARAEVERG